MLSHLTYLLLDAARMGDTMDMAKEKNPAHDSLYRGRSEESLSEVAPYLFSLAGKTDFMQWVMENGWGDSWGVFVRSSLSMEEVYKHFRKFLMVTTEDGEELYFRFYDPRVLRIFLPTCDQAQLREFFGPIEYFAMEDEDPAYATRYWLENWVLKSQKVKLDDFVGSLTRADNRIQNDVVAGSGSTWDMSLPGRRPMPSAPSMPSTPSIPPTPSVPSVASLPSAPHAPSLPSTPSVPLPPSLPSTPKAPSLPSTPSLPSAPQMPSVPSVPHTPYTPSAPSVPQPTTPSLEPTAPAVTKKKWKMFD